MAVYYPQGVMTLRVVLEDFGETSNAALNNLHIFTVVCKSITVSLNSYREADTFNAEIDFKNFPFDPRTIRSAGVTIHIEDRKKLFQNNNGLNLLKPSVESTVFQGFVDEDAISMDEESRTVKIEGRDFTSLLLDREYLGKPITLSKPLDQVYVDLLGELPETAVNGQSGLKVTNLTGEALPVLAGFSDSKAPKSGTKNPRKNRSYWDHIQDLAQKSGLVVYVSLDQLIITKPRNLYSQDRAKLFVYGENLKSLEFKRKLGRQKAVNVRVVSLDFKNKTTIEARIPEQATEAWARDLGVRRAPVTIPSVDAEGNQLEPKPAPYLTFRLRDITDFNQLVANGESLYEEIGRQQIEGSLQTNEMLICDKDNNFFNATKFRIGTPIEIGMDAGDLEGLPKLLASGTPQTQANRIKQFLIKRCYDPAIAEAFSQSLTKIKTPFFTKEVEFSLDQESGWSMKIDFINFITIPENLR